MNLQSTFRCVALLAAGFLALHPIRSTAADEQTSSVEKQRQLISVLASDAPPAEKAIACKKLAIYGGKEAVPALAPLLANAELASWARIALEAIPDPSADEALRAALPKVQGRLLVGVINSIGVRRDTQAVSVLVERLKDADTEVAAAAAESLGRIGGKEAATALAGALNTTRGDFSRAQLEQHSAVAYGCVLCAEKFLSDGQAAEAVQLYDSVRTASVPKQRTLEATRGAILARGSAGLPLLLEQLRSTDKAMLGIGLRTARELQGREVTEALAAELERTAPDRQIALFMAVADRRDAAVLPKVLQVAASGSKQIRAKALSLLDRFGDLSCVPVLLDAASGDDAELSRTAKATLGRMEGKAVDADLVARLPQASARLRQALIEMVGQRRIEAAMPEVIRSASDSDVGVRRAAFGTIGVLGDDRQAPNLAALLAKAEGANEREDIEQALLAIGGRSEARSLPAVLPLAQNSSSEVRKSALRVLASIGGANALAALKTALQDPDESVQDESVSLLATWPNNWPDDASVAEPLLALAKSGKKMSHQVQGLRGYLQYVQEDKKLTTDDKLAKIKELVPLLKRPEERRLVIASVSALPAAGGLELLTTFAEDTGTTEEACLAIVKVATMRELRDSAKEPRQKALQAVVQKTQNAATRKKAEEGLSRLN